MKYNEVKIQRKILFFSLMCLIIILTSSSYAFLTNFSKTENVITFKTGSLNMTVTNSDNTLTLTELNGKLPESNTAGLQTATPIVLNLANTGTMDIAGYDVKLVSEEGSNSTLDEIYIKYSISLDNGSTYLAPDILTNDNNIIYTGYNLKVKESKIIYLKIWIDESAGNNALNKEYYGSIKVDLYQKKDIPENQDGIYITDVSYKSNIGADLKKSKIENYNRTTMNSSIALSETDTNSSITYEITIYNSNDIDYYFNKVDYLIGADTYSNEDIIFELGGISSNQKLGSNDFVKFSITFSYKKGLSESNMLKSSLIFKFRDVICPVDERICDLSGSGNHIINVGSTWDKENGTISTDGIDDYMYIENLDFDETTEFTIDFVAKIAKHSVEDVEGNILFETSINSNDGYGAFYVDTNEYGTNELTLAMKYRDEIQNRINHKYVNNIIDNNNYRHYTITFNSMNEYDNFTRIYLDGVYQNTVTTPNYIEGKEFDFTADISGEKISSNPFYIASRGGEEFFSKISFKEIRVYKKELTNEEILLNHEGKVVKDSLLLYLDFGE